MSDDEESRDEARPDAAQVDQPEPSEDAETEFEPFDEIDEEFRPGPDVHVMGVDGLPVTVDKTQASDIPRLSTKTLVCMGDFSKFVVRDQWGMVKFIVDASTVQRMPNGAWTVSGAALLELFRDSLIEFRKSKDISTDGPYGSSDEVVLERFLHWSYGDNFPIEDGMVVVEPLRPPCRHYVRQRTSFALNAQHQSQLRLCSARRTTEGTFMTVRDTGIWACDMREPFDLETVAELDAFDKMKIEQGKHVEHLPMFGNPGGIFDSSTQRK